MSDFDYNEWNKIFLKEHGNSEKAIRLSKHPFLIKRAKTFYDYYGYYPPIQNKEEWLKLESEIPDKG